jgi:hypothetical protein
VSARRAFALADRAKQQAKRAHALRMLGETHAKIQPEQAEHFYREARELATELGMRPLQAHCHRGLDSLIGGLSRDDEAQVELSAARDLYRALDMSFWLHQLEPDAALADSGRGPG